MSWISDTLRLLTNSLYPVARAFKAPPNGVRDKLNKARNLSYARLYSAQKSILNDILPDNDNFDEQDATQWETRLGIINGGSTVSLADRKAAILQKMSYPGTVAPRCAADYITEQLQAAGFDVKVYENIFPDGGGGWETRTPSEILGITAGMAMLGTFELGEVELAETWAMSGITIIANHIDESIDATFAIPPLNYRSTFFIAAPTAIDDFATVSAVRRNEFRQLILQLKPQQTVGFMFVNYV